ncbi:lipase [Geodermatophilus sp. YIM 151500]|uniref:lipase family alpha/beta hydrolase n=1 Tax=Geodermatophilus sp. YIM 151500 TaxID=2984531 RepID=UPI0021E4E4CF|nr:lipase [Geodermatophilus sp. YIM 151500]MCV2491367.1 lipase [Geodermatophilus sp. YIM 151500]
MLAGLAPARRRLVVGLLALAVAAVVGAGAVLLVPRLAAGEVVPVPQDEPGPVLVVPGYGGSTGAVQSLADRLTAAGRDATVVRWPGDGTGDLGAAAAELGRAARAALDRTGAAGVDVVGYSAGGVVARLWVDGDGAGLTRRVVTLGSPHHGTTLADLAVDVAPASCPEGCRQLATGSDLLAALNAGDETPEGPTWVSVWTERDETVTPPESARLEGAVNVPVQAVCADARIGHGDLPRDPLVQEIVLEQLAGPAPVELTAADCVRLGG